MSLGEKEQTFSLTKKRQLFDVLERRPASFTKEDGEVVKP